MYIHEKTSFSQKWILTELLLMILFLLMGDVWLDLRDGVPTSHLILEAVAGVLGLSGIAVIWYRQVLPMQTAMESMAKERAKLESEILQWRTAIAPYVANFQEAIARQLEIWKLTPVEKETAYLLLKGLSLKDIADIRSVTEKTVKQHSQSIYFKSTLKGRAELSAFFLEDLLSAGRTVKDNAIPSQ